MTTLFDKAKTIRAEELGPRISREMGGLVAVLNGAFDTIALNQGYQQCEENQQEFVNSM